MTDTILTTEIPGLKKIATGKVREIYELGRTLLIVTTDRISAYDVVMPNAIPDKGKVLTQLSRFWFLDLRPFVANHYITHDFGYISARMGEAGVSVGHALEKQLAGRTMMVLKAEVFPVECVVRGYLAGSLWKEYVDAGGISSDVIIHGINMPGGMKESDRLLEPIFTPATKATTGHDENISFAEMRNIVGTDDAGILRKTSLDIYRLAAERALNKGIIIADTKFEFGIYNGNVTLIDEVLTPDSSRFWNAATYSPGKAQPSYDKQYLRDWLTASGWNKEPPAPELPQEVINNTAAKYRDAFRRITGEELVT